MRAESSDLQAALDDYDFHQSEYNPESDNEWARKRDLILARIEDLLVNVAPQ
ncbi:MAG: hypothetical protein ACF787_09490 [Rhodopirellula sp. JB053]